MTRYQRIGTVVKDQAPRHPRALGFTLVELMVVILILGVLTSLAVGVYVRQIGVAERRSTEALIQLLNDGLQERLESFYSNTRSLSPQPRHTELGDGTLGGGPATNELARTQLDRATIVARLDAMRGDFPQQFIDFLRSDINGASTSDRDTVGGVTYIGLGEPNVSRRFRTAVFMEYLKRTVSQDSFNRDNANPQQVSRAHPFAVTNGAGGNNLPNGYSPIPVRLDSLGTGNLIPHDPNTESSECLYLILTVAAAEGMSFDINQIDPRFLRDTDNDGLMEFVDSWGTPLRFYRWPTDYVDYLLRIERSLSSGLAGVNAMDPERLFTRPVWFTHQGGNVRAAFEGGSTRYGGYFRLHTIYRNLFLPTPTYDLSADESDTSIAVAHPLMPLIVSAGPDARRFDPRTVWQAFGLAWHDNRSNPAAFRIPEAGDMNARCARVGGYVDPATDAFVPDAAMLEAAGDNIISLEIRAGREN